MLPFPSNNKLLIYEVIFALLGLLFFILKIFYNQPLIDSSAVISTSLCAFFEILRRIENSWNKNKTDQNNLISKPAKNISIIRYNDIIQYINDSLLLNGWNELSSYFINFSIPVDYIDGSDQLGMYIFNVIWPKTIIDLENSIKNLEQRNSEFIRHFMTRAERKESEWWQEDKSWRRIQHSQEKFELLTAEQSTWQKKHLDLLLNVCLAWNEYASAVRAHVNPQYLLANGEFAVWDSLGNTNELDPIMYKPTTYR